MSELTTGLLPGSTNEERMYDRVAKTIPCTIMSQLTIGLLLGSTREGRMCDRVAKFIRNAVEKQHTVSIFDPLEMDLPQTQQSMNWFYNPSAVPDNIKELNTRISQCDAIVVMTPEYNFSAPPAIANVVDNIPPPTFMLKPCAIVSYSMGPIGGWRGAMQVRQLMGALGCTMTQKQMGIPVVHETLDSEGKPSGEKLEKLEQELQATLSQLYWLTVAINNHKKVETPPSFSM